MVENELGNFRTMGCKGNGFTTGSRFEKLRLGQFLALF
jgi:hypothetical protein